MQTTAENIVRFGNKSPGEKSTSIAVVMENNHEFTQPIVKNIGHFKKKQVERKARILPFSCKIIVNLCCQ